MLSNFRESLPGGFYKALKQKIKTMSIIGKANTERKSDGKIDTSLVYSRVITLQMTNSALRIDEVLSMCLHQCQLRCLKKLEIFELARQNLT